jgi:DNA/RNA-binding domain of Phe-tRNA-synthetase-like protein
MLYELLALCNKLLKNKSFEEALLGHVEQDNQVQRKDSIIDILEAFIVS